LTRDVVELVQEVRGWKSSGITMVIPHGKCLIDAIDMKLWALDQWKKAGEMINNPNYRGRSRRRQH
jgi:hypothetical protein